MAKEAVQYLETLMKLLPTQTRRSEEQQAFQQYSTPPTHSFVVSWAANIGKGDTVLEPSAGTGSLLVHALNAEPKAVYANELAEGRAELLNVFTDLAGVTHENAGHLNAILPKNIKPTVVVMNPPFSADTLTPGKKNTFVGANHVEQALKRLEPGGRLVAIVGRGMADNKATFKAWWRKIGAEYAVRANIGISGKEYTKYGTSFDNQIIIIDKVDPDQSKLVAGSVEKVADLVELLQEVRDGRIPKTERAPAEPASAEGVASAEGEAGQGVPVRVPADAGGPAAGELPAAAAEPGRPDGHGGRPAIRHPGTRDEIPAGKPPAGGGVPPAGSMVGPEPAGTNAAVTAPQQDGGNIDQLPGTAARADTGGVKVTKAKREKAKCVSLT